MFYETLLEENSSKSYVEKQELKTKTLTNQ